jgi:putative phage-type endonuclease
MKTIAEVRDHEAQEIQRSKNYDPAADPIVRASGLGGSDMGTILGLDQFKSPLQLWAEKRGTWPAEYAEDVGSKLPVRIGKLVEDDICEMFAEDQGIKLNRFRQTPRHKSIDWAMAHPDRRVVGKYKGKRAIVEAKYTSRVKDWGTPGTDEIPEYYLPQVHQEMWLTDAEVCLVPVWLMDFRIVPAFFIVERDEEWFDILEKLGGRFWDCVQTGTEPKIDYHDGPTQDALSKIYKEQFKPGDVVQLDDATQTITDAIEVHKEDIKRSKAAVDACVARLTKVMGTAQLGKLPNGKWWQRKKVETSGYTVKPNKYTQQKVIKSLAPQLDAYARSVIRDAEPLAVEVPEFSDLPQVKIDGSNPQLAITDEATTLLQVIDLRLTDTPKLKPDEHGLNQFEQNFKGPGETKHLSADDHGLNQFEQNLKGPGKT